MLLCLLSLLSCAEQLDERAGVSISSESKASTRLSPIS